MVAWARQTLHYDVSPPLVFPPPFFSVFCLLPVSLCLASPVAVPRPSSCQPCRLHALAISDAALPAPPLDLFAFLHARDVSFVDLEYLWSTLIDLDKSSNPASCGGVGPLNTLFASEDSSWMKMCCSHSV